MKPEPPIVGYSYEVAQGALKFLMVVVKRHINLISRRLLMDKYIGFDIDCKKTVACVVEKGKKDLYQSGFSK